MKKLSILLLVLLLGVVGSCWLLKNTPKENENGYMKTLIEWTFTYDQFDSLCVADGISNNLDDWDSMIFIGDTLNITRPVRQYMYITSSGDTTTTYSIIIHPDSSLFVNKRIMIE